MIGTDDIADFQQAAEAGLTIAETADLFGVDRSVVRSSARKANITFPAPKVCRPALEFLHRSRWTTPMIAAATDIPEDLVRSYVYSRRINPRRVLYPLCDFMKTRLIADYDAGDGTDVLSKRYRISAAEIRSYFAEWKVKRHRPGRKPLRATSGPYAGLTEDQISDVRALVKVGRYSQRDAIAAVLAEKPKIAGRPE